MCTPGNIVGANTGTVNNNITPSAISLSDQNNMSSRIVYSSINNVWAKERVEGKKRAEEMKPKEIAEPTHERTSLTYKPCSNFYQKGKKNPGAVLFMRVF